MLGRASHASSSMLHVALVVTVVFAAAACSKKRGRALLPKISKTLPKAADQKISNDGVEYRRQGGQAIAPVVISDDPGPTEAPTGAGQPATRGTLNGDPNGITRETLNRSIQGSMGALAACFTNITQDPMVAVSFEADPSGRPSLVRVNGAPPDAERCIRSVVQGIRFPSFEGKGVQVDLPLSFHHVRSPAANPAGHQEQPGAPPLFLEP
jgi:hypothetical protein